MATYFYRGFLPLIGLFLIIGVSCSKKTASADSTPVASNIYFIIGSGGGVSGLYEQYKVYPSGVVEWYNFDEKTYVPYSTLAASSNKDIWTDFQALNVMDQNIDRPGNYSYYIEEVNGDRRNRVTWSDENDMPIPTFKSFFRTTERLLKNTK